MVVLIFSFSASASEVCAQKASGRGKAPMENALIVEMIRHLYDSGERINAHAMNKDLGGTRRKLLNEKFGYKAKASSLLRVAILHFKSWDEALMAAGLDPVEIRQREWSAEKTVRALTMLRDLGVHIESPNEILASEYTPHVLRNIRGASFAPISFYAYVNRNFGHWGHALRILGLYARPRAAGSE